MSGMAIGLVLVSTFLHAAWNLMARRRRGMEAAFFVRMLIVVMVVGFVPAVVSEIVTRSLPPKAWLCVVISGVCCGVYYFSLGRAYASSDFTIVYPVARSLPVLLVGLGDVLRGRSITPLGWLGLSLVALGCILIPLKSFRSFDIRQYLHHSIAWMALTALGTVGYSLSDKVASEVILAGPGSAARYGYFFFSIAGIIYYCLKRLTERKNEKVELSLGWKMPAIGGLCTFGAYWLVLYAYQMSRHASYIVAFRQFSIVLGVVFAFIFFKEDDFVVRITGTIVITAGLVITAIYAGA